ncbi:MAG TPA: heme-degrading domain-containing protein [Devosia sp.]|nr:heme-degrading domain-containing protein [Devosia sp.]
MAVAEDIQKIIAQEQGLVFPEFNERVAFALATQVRERAKAETLGIACSVRLWDRPLVYFGMPGATADNEHWIRRKSNVVQRLMKASYRAKLENNEEKMFPPHRNLPVDEFALSGGSFPIRVKGIGIVGAATVSGLHERVDHEIVVRAICQVLELDPATFALPA